MEFRHNTLNDAEVKEMCQLKISKPLQLCEIRMPVDVWVGLERFLMRFCNYGNVMTTTRWRLYVTMERLWQQQDVICILHLQKYSRRLNLFVYFFFSLAKQLNSGLGRHIVKVTRLHTTRHTHTRTVGLLWRRDQPVAEDATYGTQQTQRTNSHALSGIRTRNPSNNAPTVLRLRPHGHRDRPYRR